jgi:hypothetical protein
MYCLVVDSCWFCLLYVDYFPFEPYRCLLTILCRLLFFLFMHRPLLNLSLIYTYGVVMNEQFILCYLVSVWLSNYTSKHTFTFIFTVISKTLQYQIYVLSWFFSADLANVPHIQIDTKLTKISYFCSGHGKLLLWDSASWRSCLQQDTL